MSKLQKEFIKLKTQLLRVKPFRRGSLVKYWNVCGNPNCRCKKAKKYRHGPYYVWTKKVKGKTVTLKIPKAKCSETKVFIENAEFLKHLLNKLEEISDKIIRLKINSWKNI